MGHAKLKAVKKPELLKLDLGCGKSKREGFLGVDRIGFDGVDVVIDLCATEGTIIENGTHPYVATSRFMPWPWANESVSEVHCSHFLEHLTGMERVHFVNELYRVLVPSGSATIVTPHWASNRAYGDVTHQWPPVSEMWFYYLDKGWREANAPHNSFYACDFAVTWGYGMRPDLQNRNAEYQQYAFQNYKEVITDMMATMKKR